MLHILNLLAVFFNYYIRFRINWNPLSPNHRLYLRIVNFQIYDILIKKIKNNRFSYFYFYNTYFLTQNLFIKTIITLSNNNIIIIIFFYKCNDKNDIEFFTLFILLNIIIELFRSLNLISFKFVWCLYILLIIISDWYWCVRLNIILIKSSSRIVELMSFYWFNY